MRGASAAEEDPLVALQDAVVKRGGKHGTDTSTTSSASATTGSSERVEKHLSTILGAGANLSNDIVGAVIAGIPFGVASCGLITGIAMIVVCGWLADKSLNILFRCAQKARVPNYESLAEIVFGRLGFWWVALSMTAACYGTVVGYLMMMKETLPYCFGIVDPNQRDLFLLVISLAVMVPVSSQRDMADLSITSRINIVCCVIITAIVVYLSPIQATVETNGGLWQVVGSSVVHPSTLFAGIGICSFSYMVQQSSMLIAGSLRDPTKERWQEVTSRSIILCIVLLSICGGAGYLGFMGNTKGNILDNFNPKDPLANIGRGLLGVVMFFIYPIEAHVLRHLVVVVFFPNPDGEYPSVLYNDWKRIGLTLAVYVWVMIPAVMFRNLGPVLSLTGTIGGSFLSYMGPGAVYIGLHGQRFLELSGQFFGSDTATDTKKVKETNIYDGGLYSIRPKGIDLTKSIVWCLVGMPIWSRIAAMGSRSIANHTQQHQEDTREEAQEEGQLTTQSDSAVYGSMANDQSVSGLGVIDNTEQAQVGDFGVAIFLVVFGAVALVAGTTSVWSQVTSTSQTGN